MEEFEKVFELYYTDVYRFLLKLSNYNSELAEEYSQETFYYAYLSFPNFKGQCQLKTWLIQIAKNRFYMMLRKRKNSSVYIEELTVDPCANNYIDDEFIKSQICKHSRIIIDSMAPNMRDVMLYRIYSDLPYSQIRLLLMISESSAKVLFHRGKNILRTKLKEEYGYEI